MDSRKEPTHGESSGSMDSLVVISLIPKCVVATDIPGSWTNPHITSLSCSIRVITVEKAKWKQLTPHLFPPGQYCIHKIALHSRSGGAEISGTLRYCKDEEMLLSLFNWPALTLQPLDGPRE